MKTRSKGDSPYGRCIYKCDNDVVDHQSVMVQFASGATGTHNMVGGSSAPLRRIHIIGTKGEIYGNFEESKFYVSKIDPSPDAHNGECQIEEVDLNVKGDMVGAYGGHGGGPRTLCSSSAAKSPAWHAPLFSTLLPVTCVCIWQTKVAPTAASR